MSDFRDTLSRLKDLAFPGSERARMRGELQLFMNEHPARAPFSVRVSDAMSSYLSNSSSAYRPLAAAFALVLVVGIGTSYAAEGALPGDALYPIKVYFNESIEGSLAVSESAQASWNTELIERRLEEAEALAAQDRLTPVARAQIETSLTMSANKIDATVATLSKKSDGLARAAEVQSSLEASLEGHEQVLAALSADIPGAKDSIAPVLASVRVHATGAENKREHAETAIAKADTKTVRAAAIAKQKAANEAVQSVSTLSATAPEPMAMMMSADATSATTTVSADEAITIGEDKLRKGEFGDAYKMFQAIIRAAQTAKVDIDAQSKLNTEIRSDSGTGSGTLKVEVSH